MKCCYYVFIVSILISSAKGCRKEILVTVADGSEGDGGGVVLSIFQAKENSDAQLSNNTGLDLKQERLSGECGSRYERCQDLLTVEYINSTDLMKHEIVFIPLDGAFAIVDVLRDSNTGNIDFKQLIIRRTDGKPLEISCSPSAFFKIQDGYYSVCTNKTTNFVSVFEIFLNLTSLQNTTFSYPTNSITIPFSIGNINNATNFLHLEVSGNEYIIFAVGTAVYSMRPFYYSVKRLGDVSADCDSIRLLAPKQGAEFWAHCTNHTFRYDIGFLDWMDYETTADGGIPYQCPGAAEVRVYSKYINISMDGLEQTVLLQGSHFVYGACLGNGSSTFFLYTDRLTGVNALNLKSGETKAIMSSACNDLCFPLVLVNNSYLIVRDSQKGEISVQNLFQNPPEVFKGVKALPPIAGLLSLPCPPPQSDLPGLGIIEVNPPDPSASGGIGPAGIGGLVVALVVLYVAAVSVIVVIITIVVKRRKTTEQLKPPVPAAYYNPDSSGTVVAAFDTNMKRAEIAQETQEAEGRTDLVQPPSMIAMRSGGHGLTISSSEQPSAVSNESVLEDNENPKENETLL